MLTKGIGNIPIILGGAAAWTPASPTTDGGVSPWAWQDASTESGYSDGDPFTPFTDQSGNARSPAQATTSKKPTYKENIQNSLPAILFDDTDDYLFINDLTLFSTANFTIFLVGKYSAKGILFSFTNGATSSYYCLEFKVQSTSQVDMGYGDGSNAAGKNLNTGDISSSCILTIQRETVTTLRVWNNGASKLDTTIAGATYYLDIDRYALGGRLNNGNENVAGYIHEILVYSTVLSTADIDQIEAYLSEKWGIELS